MTRYTTILIFLTATFVGWSTSFPLSGYYNGSEGIRSLLAPGTDETKEKTYLMRNMAKEIYKQEFISRLYKHFGLENNPISVPEQYKNTSFSGKIKNLVAKCNTPKETGSDEWTQEESFNLYFDLLSAMKEPSSSVKHALQLSGGIFNAPRNENSLGVKSAKLNLYKLESEKFYSTDSGNDLHSDSHLSHSRLIPSVETDASMYEKIKVSVYYYTAPLTKSLDGKNKILLDTKMVEVKNSEWIELDVLKAVSDWIKSGNEFGLLVQVENDKDEILDAKKYFSFVSCTTDDSNEDISSQSFESSASTGGNAPKLEICTVAINSSGQPSTLIDLTKSAPTPKPATHHHWLSQRLSRRKPIYSRSGHSSRPLRHYRHTKQFNPSHGTTMSRFNRHKFSNTLKSESQSGSRELSHYGHKASRLLKGNLLYSLTTSSEKKDVSALES